MNIFRKLFGTHSDREIKLIMPLVDKVMSYEEEFSKLTDAVPKITTPADIAREIVPSIFLLFAIPQ